MGILSKLSQALGGFVNPNVGEYQGPTQSGAPVQAPNRSLGQAFFSKNITPEEQSALRKANAAILQGQGDFFNILGGGVQAYDQGKTDYQNRQMALEDRNRQIERDKLALQSGRLKLSEAQEQAGFRNIRQIAGGVWDDDKGDWLISPEDAARKRAAISRSGANLQFGNTYETPMGPAVGIRDPNSGSIKFQLTETGQILDKLPEGSLDRRDSGQGKFNDLSAKALNRAYEEASASYETMRTLDTLESVGVSQAGSTVWAQTGRTLATMFGLEFNDYSAENIGIAAAKTGDLALDAAKKMQGQGQITENERRLIERTIPDLKQNPAAFSTILETLRKGLDRKTRMMEDWDNLVDQPNNFQAWRRKWLADDLDKEKAGPVTSGTTNGIGWTLED